MTEPFHGPDVENVFNGYSHSIRNRLMWLRQAIFDEAATREDVGPLEETLKWGQPSYLTVKTGSGTTIRIDQCKLDAGHYGMFVHCQTSLIASYRDLYGDRLLYDGKRCVKFDVNADPPESMVRHCIALALIYHLDKC